MLVFIFINFFFFFGSKFAPPLPHQMVESEFKFVGGGGGIYKQCIQAQTQKITLVYLLYCIFLLGIHLHMNSFLIKNSVYNSHIRF